MSEIGDFIKRIRIENEMNITDLARLSGISRPYLSQIESGKRNPSNDLLYKLSKALDVSYSVMLEKAGDKELAKAVKNSRSNYDDLINRIVDLQQNDSLGEFIRAIRIALNYSIDDVAKTTGLPVSVLKSIESNKETEIDKETLYRISVHFEKDLLNIFTVLLQLAGHVELPDHSYIDILYDNSGSIEESQKVEEMLIQHRFSNKSYIELLQEQERKSNTFHLEKVLSNDSEVYYEDVLLTNEEKDKIKKFIMHFL